MDPKFSQGESKETSRKPSSMQPILDGSSFVILALDANGNCILINAAGRRFFDISPDQDLQSIVLPQASAWQDTGLSNLIQLALQTMTEQRFELQWPSKVGAGLWVKVDLIPYSLATGKRVILMLEDTTLPHTLSENLEDMVKDRTQALDASEKRYQSLADAIPAIVFTVDTHEKITYINQVGVQFAQKKRAEIIGSSLCSIYPPELAASLMLDLNHILETGEPVSREDEAAIDGQTYWLSTQLSAIKNKAGGIDSVIGLARDITPGKQVEAELRQSRYLLKLIIDSIPQRIYWKDLESRYMGFNQAFSLDQRISKPDDLVGKTDAELSWNENSEEYNAEDQFIIASDTPKLEYQEHRRMPEGRIMWVRSSKVPLHEPDGKTFGILTTYDDITDEKWMEAHLKENDLRFRSTFEQAAVGIAHINPQDRFILVNQRFCEILGYSREEMGQLGLEILTHPEDRQVVRENLLRFQETSQRNFQKEVRFLAKNGSPVWVELTASSVQNPQGAIQYWVAVVEDIRERKEAAALLARRTQELARSNQLIGFLSQISAHLEPTRDPLQVMETLGHELKRMKIYLHVALKNLDGSAYEVKYSSLPRKIVNKLEVLIDQKLVGLGLPVDEDSPLETGRSWRAAVNSSVFNLFLNPTDRDENWLILADSFAQVSANFRAFTLPLQIGDRVLGFLEFWSKNIEAADIPAFSVFANQVAAALEASRLYQEIAHQAIRDELTGLLNRRGFFTLGEQQIRLQERFDQYLNLVYLDLDEFKHINDVYGHQVGDQALVDVADLLRKNFRNADIIGRIGGDEFVVLTVEKKRSDPNELLLRLEERFADFNARTNRPYKLMFSAGIVSCELCSKISLDDWLAEADEIMYQNKRTHKTHTR